MKTYFESDLVESVVNQHVGSGNSSLHSRMLVRFQGEREVMYRMNEGGAREEAFRNFYMKWFCEWKFDRPAGEIFREYPLFESQLDTVVFRRTCNPSREGADLFVNDQGMKNLGLMMRPSWFASPIQLSEFLHHEFMHIHDMLDPVFGYRKDLGDQGGHGSRRQPIRQRYRLLWDVSIDGRLAARKKIPESTCKIREAEFSSAFSFWNEQRKREVFGEIWHGDRPTHEELISIAADPRHEDSSVGPRPGGLCPLCSFPTFEWADISKMTTETRRQIQGGFPDWKPSTGICGRCLEIYEALQMEHPATLCIG